MKMFAAVSILAAGFATSMTETSAFAADGDVEVFDRQHLAHRFAFRP